MKYFLPKPLTYVSTNVAENEAEDGSTYVDYNALLGYNKGTVRKFGENIYEALVTMYPLAHYVWEDVILTDKHAINLTTQAEQYPDGTNKVLVSIVTGVTVVFVRSNGNYYIAKTTATVDFMVESILTPANFNLIAAPAPYRNTYNTPVGESDTLYWGYNGVANKYRCLDRAIGTQTTKNGAGSLTMSLSCFACNAISLFGVKAASVTITVWDLAVPASPTQLFTTTISLLDTFLLDTYEKVCTLSVPLDNTASAFFVSRYAQRIDLVFSGVDGPSVGAVKVGMLEYLGETLDGVDVGVKSYNTSEQRPNGEIVWNKDNKETNKVNTLRYNVKMETANFDATVHHIKTITDREVVLLGDDGDPAGYRTLLSYGAIKRTSGNLRSNDTKSSASIEIENFV